MINANTEPQNQAWFALADAEICRLMCLRLTGRGRQHVDEHGKLENTFPEQEHARPMTGAGTTHHVEEKERRFASKVIDWLQTAVAQRQIQFLTIFASPRILGILREVPSGALKGHVAELWGNLMHLNPSQLAKHPMVRRLVEVPH